MQLSRIYVHPLKGAQGFEPHSLRFGRWGPEWDRVFLIVNEKGMFVTQRSAKGQGVAIKQMCLIRATISAGFTHLLLDAPNRPQLRVSLYPRGTGNPVNISIWGYGTDASYLGHEAEQWLTRFLSPFKSGSYRLVRMLEPRPTDVGSEVTSFTDGHQVLAVHEASLADLNRRMRLRQLTEGEPVQPIGWNRIRPTIVFSGGIPGRRAYAEDRLDLVRVGSVTLEGHTPCTRCAMTLVDQATGDSGKEPLRTLSTYRTGLRASSLNMPCFGRNYNATGGGVMTLGDRVIVHSRHFRTRPS
jgi:uncharacterized protein YcbX